jgi:hypothetical protein
MFGELIPHAQISIISVDVPKIGLLISIKYLYVSGVELGVTSKTDTKETCIEKK